jgi:hypothetical protein
VSRSARTLLRAPRPTPGDRDTRYALAVAGKGVGADRMRLGRAVRYKPLTATGVFRFVVVPSPSWPV